MRNVREKENKKILEKELQKFTFDNISTFLFAEKPFEITILPFVDWKNSPLKNTLVTFQIRHTLKSEIAVEETLSVISKINNKEVDFTILRNLPFVILEYLHYHYTLQVRLWEKYFYNNIKEYSKTSTSEIMWQEVKHSNNYGISSFAKAIWLTICETNHREFWMKFAISLRESILPWLNAEMYKHYKDRKDNTRFNVEYTKQRQLMIDGNIEKMDVELPEDIKLQLKKNISTSFKGGPFSNNDLDEIKAGI